MGLIPRGLVATARSQLCHGLDSLPAGMARVGAVVRAEGKSCFSNLVLLLPELGTARPAPAPAPPPAQPRLWPLVLLFGQEPRQHPWVCPEPMGGVGLKH